LTNTEITTPASSLRMVQLDSIAESKTNPRKTFNPATLHELADSIKEKGVIQPILLRPIEGLQPFEIVCGARRVRASRLAGKEEIVAIVADLDDRQVLEVHLIENAQREDVPPLEEAEGYQQLIDEHGHTLATLAKKTGKSEHHIALRIKLLDLSANAREALGEGRINIGHANLLARLSIDNQEQLMSWLLPYYEKDCATKATIALLRNHIESKVYRQISQAPFSISEKYLLAGVPACTECPKNSAAQTALFAELSGHAVCTDGKCFDSKLEQHLKIELKKAEDGKSKLILISSHHDGDYDTLAIPVDTYKVAEPRDKSAEKALLVDGPDKGKYIRVTVLPEAEQWLNEAKEEKKAEAEMEEQLDSSTPKKTYAETLKEEAQKREKTKNLRRRMRSILLTGIQAYDPKGITLERLQLILPPDRYETAETRRIFEDLVGAESGQFAKGIPKSFWDEQTSINAYFWAVAALRLAAEADCGAYESNDFTALQLGYAEFNQIDLVALRKQAKEELKTEAKAPKEDAPAKGKKTAAKKLKKTKKAAAVEPEPTEEAPVETPAKKRGRKPKAS
jgi:ParB/RepB/Spo0J family partition protein